MALAVTSDQNQGSFTPNSKMYCTLQWFKTVDHNTEAIVNEKETTCHHCTSRDLAFHCISCINKYSCTGLNISFSHSCDDQ